MKLIFTLILIAASAAAIAAQDTAANTLTLIIQNLDTKAPVAGAVVTVRDSDIRTESDAAGRVVLTGIQNGTQTIDIFSPGFEPLELSLAFPQSRDSERVVMMRITNEVGEVVITTTRTGREIDDVPTRVEAIDEEEVAEKSNMRSSNVSMILNESTGIKVQQTSAASYSQSIRIQGLDGRYTQILKDGFPAFGGFSGSMSLLDILPLDLKQVEIIKGPSATFYGGGAIAGVVNFVSKEPDHEPATSMIFNQTSALGTDYSIFDTRKFGRFGYTLLGSINYQKEYDVDGDDFTELPRTRAFNINPRLFFYLDQRTSLMIGNSTTRQSRKGGDIFVLRHAADNDHQYFEASESLRNITTVQFDRDLSNGRKVIAKQSLSFFDRSIETPDHLFKGRQFNSYTDVSYFHPVKNHALVLGFNAVYDQFRELSARSNNAPRNETRATVGAYVQDSFEVTEKLSLEAGFRLDAVRHYGIFALPRVSVLYRFTEGLSTRAGVGFGYKAPSMFTEDAETLLFHGVLPIGNRLEAERSFGGTWDINYRGDIGEKFTYSVNQMFFYTEIDKPLVLESDGKGIYSFANASDPVRSTGFETNLRLGYDIFRLFAGYTFTNAKADYLAGNRYVPLTPKSRLNSALLVERENDFKAGFEAYYTGSQFLRDGSGTRPFWVMGLFGEKTFGKVSLFINAENIGDTRQSRFGPVVFGPHQNPSFADIYTHTEGRIFNGGIRLRL